MTRDTQPWRDRLARPAEYIEYLKDRDREVGACLEIREPEPSALTVGRAAAEAAGAGETPRSGEIAYGTLAGLPFAVKNNIAVRGWRLTCGSKLLSEVVAPYTATAVERLVDAGAVVVATTNLDEFGMGSSTDNSALGRTNNPRDLSRVAGGSSGGSAAAVGAGEVPFALGSDTGGSVRQPAAFCGVYGLKPTYGAVSRYGLTAYASSLETIGVLSSSPDLAEAVFETMSAPDPRDQTSVRRPVDASDEPVRRVAALRVGEGLSAEVSGVYRDSIRAMREAGLEVDEIDIPSLEYAVPAYYTIAAAEASANLARFNGIRYGMRPFHSDSPQDLIMDARSDGLGAEVKLRIMLGTFVLRSGFQDQYYGKAQRIRTRIARDMDSVFASYGALLSPVFPTTAFAHGDASMDAFAQRLADKFTVTANLAGIPALSFPAGVRGGLPVGLQLHAPAFAERRLFSLLRSLAECFPALPCGGPLVDGGER